MFQEIHRLNIEQERPIQKLPKTRFCFFFVKEIEHKLACPLPISRVGTRPSGLFARNQFGPLSGFTLTISTLKFKCFNLLLNIFKDQKLLTEYSF